MKQSNGFNNAKNILMYSNTFKLVTLREENNFFVCFAKFSEVFLTKIFAEIAFAMEPENTWILCNLILQFTLTFWPNSLKTTVLHVNNKILFDFVEFIFADLVVNRENKKILWKQLPSWTTFFYNSKNTYGMGMKLCPSEPNLPYS